ncbi:MAG TPA: alpha-2-macroglobulin family protein, partial [Planctomycetota bacterium]|nr:alpha-2-macroglobulin family protein [Planctomycetota bacterium]
GVVRPGENAAATVAATTYLGEPVPGAAFRWEARVEAAAFDAARYRDAAWFYRATEVAREGTPWDVGEVPTPATVDGAPIRGDGRLDDAGRATISFRTAPDETPKRYVVHAWVDDATRAVVRGTGAVVAARAPGGAVVLLDRRAYRVGDRVAARVIAGAWDGGPLRVQGVAELIALRTENGRTTEEPLDRFDVDVGARGETEIAFEAKRAGRFLVRFKAAGADGVVAEAAAEAWGERPDVAREARLRFDRETYRAGETARVHVEVPEVPAVGLLTFEAETTLWRRVVRLTERASTLEVELPEALAPNVVAAWCTFAPDRLLVAEDPIVVLRHLDVQVTPSVAKARPGEKVRLKVTAKDQAGRPAVAAVTLSMVDAALRDASGEDELDPRFTFNRDLRAHLVRTSASVAFRSGAEAESLDADLVRLAEDAQRREASEEFKKGAILALPADDRPGAPRPAEAARESEQADRRAAQDVIGTGGGGGGTYGGRRGGMVKPAGGGAPAERASHDDKSDAEAAKNKDAFVARVVDAAELEELRKSVPGGMLRGEARDAPPDVEVRRRFDDVALWAPRVVTGPDGAAEVEVALTEDLGLWAISATAIDAGAAAGLGRASLPVAKELTTRVGVPRNLVTGDAIDATVVVRHAFDRTLPLRATLRAPDATKLVVDGPYVFDADAAPGAQATFDVRLRALAAGSTTLEAEAFGADAAVGDALAADVVVRPFGAPWRVVERRRLVDQGAFVVEIPGDLVPGSLAARLEVQAGIPGALLEGLAFLEGSPRPGLAGLLDPVAATAVAHRAFLDAGLASPVSEPSLRAAVERAFASLRAWQEPDGGFSAWPKGAAEPGAAAFALDRILLLTEAGYPPPDDLRQAALAAASAAAAATAG